MDGLEWEAVGGGGGVEVPSGPLESSFMADATGAPRPHDWRERMKLRQRFWSQSHGFKVRLQPRRPYSPIKAISAHAKASGASTL